MTTKYSLTVLKDSHCKHGLVREASCDKAEHIFLEEGLPPLQACSRCSMVSSLETLNITKPLKTSQVLEVLGVKTTSKARVHDVICQVHDQPVVSDCTLSSCAFSTTYPGVRNCILVYMSKHKAESLSPLDLSMLLGIPHKTITEDTSQALKLLRQNSVVTTTSFDLEPQFTFHRGSRVCCNCDQVIETPYKEVQGVFYCSSECEEEKPYPIVLLEEASGNSIRTLLSWATSKYLTLQAFQQALRLDSFLLDSLLLRYFGYTASEMYASSSTTPAPQPLAKRLGRSPTWLKGVIDCTSGLQDLMIEAYGPVRVDLSPLQRELDGIL